ncbi:MAG: hypothetical protein Q7U18_09075 [Methylobacter sp.]|nr:hypothetical protein [Methylobacter sp.]
MAIFKDTQGTLNKLNTLPLDKEKNLQKLVEDNLMEVLELRFLATEYTTTFGGRIDTLAVDIVDPETGKLQLSESSTAIPIPNSSQQPYEYSNFHR